VRSAIPKPHKGIPRLASEETEQTRAAAYSFGFQGQENDNEIHGAPGTSLNYEFRMHDPRVGRFFSLDPLATKYPHNSPYAFSENRIIDGIELEGLEVVLPTPGEIWAYWVLSKFDRFNNLTPEEQRTAMKLGVVTTLKIGNSADLARSFVESRGLKQNSYDGNALRHCFGQAHATFSADAASAKSMGDAHEGNGKYVLASHPDWVATLEKDGRVNIPNMVADNFVDLWNNEVGREIGESPSLINPETGTVDFRELQRQVLDAHNSGKLIKRTGELPDGSTWVEKTKEINETGDDNDSSVR
jgi:RHS repeat-associated protein